MVSATDGSDITSGTPAVYYTIDGGTQGTGAGTSTHEGNGQWSYVPAQPETNGDHVAFTMVISGAISQTVNVYPVSYDPTDSVRLGLTALPNAAADAAGGLLISDAGGFDVDAINTQLADIPTVSEFNARTLASADYFDPATDTVANVTLVATTTTNTDMRGTDNAATASALATAQSDLDTILTDTGTTIPSQISGLNNLSAAQVNAEVDTALSDYDPPTRTELTADTNSILSRIGTPTDFGSGTSTIAANLQDLADDGTATYDRTTDSLQAVRDHIGDGTNLTEVGGDGDHLTAIDLPNQTMDITGSISGSVGSVTGGINTSGGTITTLDALDAAQDTQHSTTQSALSTLAGKFTGITSVANWLRLFFRKDTAIAIDASTELAEINADGGSGAGSYVSTTDSLEATQDDLTTVSTAVSGIQTDLDNGTDGLGALKVLIDAVQATADAVEVDTQDIQSRLPSALVNSRMDCTIDGTGMESGAISAIFTTALTEAYRSTGSTGTAAQLLYEILAHLGEFSISGTTKTTNKLDGSTPAKTYTLNDGTSPTGITEAT